MGSDITKYKNKLAHIIRTNKEYYKTLLNDNKNNIKGIQLNTIIRNCTTSINYPKYFIDDGKENYNTEDAANSFNKFFVSVGPDLAEQIPDPGANGIGEKGNKGNFKTTSLYL